MAGGKHQEIHDVEETKKMVPLITREMTFGQHVSKLVLGVNILDLDLVVQIYSVKQSILRNSVNSGHVSHRRTCAFDDHFDHSFIILKKNIQLSSKLRRTCVCDNMIHI